MKTTRSLMGYLVITLKGFCMGAADVVPGVSGGTIAFIAGIYEELLNAIRSFDLHFLKLVSSIKIKNAMDHASWQFLLALVSGILVAVFTLARALSWLLQNQPTLIWSFFFGLILASALTISRYTGHWKAVHTLWMITGAVGAYFLVGMVPVSTPNTRGFLFLSGAIAICAMILPGISGSFILVLLGKYEYILDAVNHLDIFILLQVAAGAAVGLTTFVRLLSWLLKRHHDLTMALLTGFMLGSLRKVWPWKEAIERSINAHGQSVVLSQANILPPQWDTEAALALLLAALGFFVVLSLNRLAGKNKHFSVLSE